MSVGGRQEQELRPSVVYGEGGVPVLMEASSAQLLPASFSRVVDLVVAWPSRGGASGWSRWRSQAVGLRAAGLLGGLGLGWFRLEFLESLLASFLALALLSFVIGGSFF